MDPSLDDSSSIEEEDYDEKIKLMIIGDSSVGKTSLLKKYCKNEFSNSYITTVGIDFQIKILNINNKKIKIQIWDTAGEERYRIVAKNYFNTSDGFIIMYDITNRESFDDITNWIEQIRDSTPNYKKSVIFGNKSDLNKLRDVQINEGKELAKKNEFKFFETSAKDGLNLNEGIESLVKDVLEDIDSIKLKRRNTTSLKEKKKSKVKKKVKEPCC